MGLEVLGQLTNPLAQDGNLHFRASGIRLVRAESVDDVGLSLSG
jgi:hypothetical protein